MFLQLWIITKNYKKEYNFVTFWCIIINENYFLNLGRSGHRALPPPENTTNNGKQNTNNNNNFALVHWEKNLVKITNGFIKITILPGKTTTDCKNLKKLPYFIRNFAKNIGKFIKLYYKIYPKVW